MMMAIGSKGGDVVAPPLVHLPKENKMKKSHINYLIKLLQQERSIMRRFLKVYPEAKDSGVMKTHKLQLEIIKALQSLKGE